MTRVKDGRKPFHIEFEGENIRRGEYRFPVTLDASKYPLEAPGVAFKAKRDAAVTGWKVYAGKHVVASGQTYCAIQKDQEVFSSKLVIKIDP